MRRKDETNYDMTEPRLRECEIPETPKPEAESQFVVQLLPGGGMILHYPVSASAEAGTPVAARVYEYTIVPGPEELQ